MSDTPSQDTGFTAALKREFLLYRARAADILISLSVLAISMVVVSSLFSAGTLRDMPIAVIDQDNSSLSRTYIRMLDASPEMEVVDSLVSPLEARELLEQASIYAFVVVPKDFRKDLKAGRQTTVVAWHSGQFLTVSGNIMKSLTAVTATMSAGANMTALEMQGESRFAADVNFMPIQAELRTLFNPFHNYQYFLVAGLLPAMLQVFVMIWTVYLVGLEFQNGTAGKWQATAGNVVNAVMAKVLPIFVLSSVIGLLCLIWLFAIAAWPIAGSLPLLIVAWILMIAAYIVLGLVFACFAPKLATALSVAVFFTAPAFAYAGVTFPQQAMPLLAQFWTYILPIKSLLKLQIEQVEIGASLANSMPEIFILLAFIVLPLPLALYKISARSRALQASA